MEKILSTKRKLFFKPEIGIFEQEAWSTGAYLCGIDEVGRGCFAGPVVAVAAILPLHTQHELLVDSKILTETKRDVAYAWLQEHALWATGIVSPQQVDECNIYKATQKAMRKAVYGLFSALPAHDNINSIAIDAMPLEVKGLEHIPVHAYPKGEWWSPSIAAASIIAKVTRDRLMADMASHFPTYHFQGHKGYGTAVHQESIQRAGPSFMHRVSFLKSFAPTHDTAHQQSLF